MHGNDIPSGNSFLSLIILGDKVKEGEIEIESTKTGKKIIVQKSKIVDMVDKKDIKREINEIEI